MRPTRASRLALCELTRVLKTARTSRDRGSGENVEQTRQLLASDAGSSARQTSESSADFRVRKRYCCSYEDRTSRIPACTYRLQFNRDFTFAQAREIVPYLHELGISDGYASPYFQARAESLHGYDITDHNKLNAAIGSREEYDAWVAELHAHEMGQIARFRAQPHGHWRAAQPLVDGRARKRPELTLRDLFRYRLATAQDGSARQGLDPDSRRSIRARPRARRTASPIRSRRFFLCYFEHEFPIAPGHLSLHPRTRARESERSSRTRILRGAPKHPDRARIFAAPHRDRPGTDRRTGPRKGNHQAPPGTPLPGSAAVAEGDRESTRESTADRATRAVSIRWTNSLNAQAYRLAFWRVAAEEINYRRFFDVNDLAAIRMELPEVFEATHRLVIRAGREPARSPACASITPTGFICLRNISRSSRRCAKAHRSSAANEGRRARSIS